MTWADAFDIFIRIAILMAVIIAFSRVFGLRSFSKLSGFDFAVTVALGSVLANGITALDKSLWVPILAIAALFMWQMVVAPIRTRWTWFENTLDNRPLVVVENGEILEANLHQADMTRADLWAKLRDANVGGLAQVQAAVVETTGVFTVLHGHDRISPELLEDVRR
ncbi:hypothetical protein ATO8_18969 [Roseivivax marinus]|uniref:YetF C-terminal domain-containing protein n=1 Tax=Roseivivax marinus TaxID=1379903 RepID=W4HG54_9RHOB|nr:YetF domain-containing protein [Roseivivax marinus]ETW11131.1 hypothetical protein ATO8_18969 [Roseivivax marinus]